MPPTNMIVANQPLGTVAYISTKVVDEPFCFSLAQMVAFSAQYATPPGYYLPGDHATEGNQITCRNELVKKMQGNWLLQIDSDHKFEPDLLVRMLSLFENNHLDVLSGLYHFKQPPHNPVLFQYDDGRYKAVLTWDRRDEVKLLPIGATGAGVLLVRRSVFDRIRKEQGEMPFNNFPPCKFDDFNFFERCRVLGIKCWCAPLIEALHMGMTAYGSGDYNSETFEPASSTLCEVGV